MRKVKVLSAHEASVGTYEGHEVTACIGNDGKPFVRVGVLDFDPDTLLGLTLDALHALGVLERHAGRHA